jgi:hypothetical protein
MKTVGAVVLILLGIGGIATLPAFLADRPDVPHDPLTVLGAFGYYALCLLVGLWNLRPRRRVSDNGYENERRGGRRAR